jgi:hypothetical protein
MYIQFRFGNPRESERERKKERKKERENANVPF